MAKKGSSRRWMQEHLSDEYVKKAQKEGYRCRAVYKLLEIIEKGQLIKSGDKVLDLGAAPGGWSQVAVKFTGKSGQVIASDILPIEEISGVSCLQGDFTEQSVYDDLILMTNGNKVDTVLSDMAPNMSGQLSVDQPKSMYLAELALDMAVKTLVKKWQLHCQSFSGRWFLMFTLKMLEKFLKKFLVIKPKASRPRSKEVYLLASQLK